MDLGLFSRWRLVVEWTSPRLLLVRCSSFMGIWPMVSWLSFRIFLAHVLRRAYGCVLSFSCRRRAIFSFIFFFGKWAYLFPVFSPLCSVLPRFLRSPRWEYELHSRVQAQDRIIPTCSCATHARMEDVCFCRGTRHFLHVRGRGIFASKHTRVLHDDVMTIKCEDRFRRYKLVWREILLYKNKGKSKI